MTANQSELFSRADLDAITEHILSGLEETEPDFLMNSEKNIEKEITAYTEHILQLQPSGVSDATSLTEDSTEKILDSICESNRVYFRTGIKIGAVLLLQLLDL